MKSAILLLVLLAGGVGVWLYSQHQRDAADSAAQSVEAAPAPSAEMLLAQASPLPAAPHRPLAAPLQAVPRAAPSTPMPTADKAADLTTLSGRTYKKARVFRVEPDGINYMFAGGIVKVPFDDLPSAVGEQYGYDPARARAFAAQDDAAQAQLAASVAASNRAAYNQTAAVAQAKEDDKQTSSDLAAAAARSPTWIGEVDERVDQGLIVRVTGLAAAATVRDTGPSGWLGGENREIYLRGYPGEATVGDSDQIRFRAVPSGNATIGGRHLHVYLYAPTD